MRTKYSFNQNHAGHKCYRCDGPIYGEGIIAEIVGEDEGCTCYHVDCYSKAWAELVKRQQERIEELEVVLKRIAGMSDTINHLGRLRWALFLAREAIGE